ncbi:hypothetical protein PIB30_030351 [Stylosanthes scabra]|uniref:Uncharacterized protein n=1 Tax=Stylosanthes scabra TaxID=79078 RepID=A0ABU6VDR1_9FABA|nr:hypothetical protein [Stylosanthes scabra]
MAKFSSWYRYPSTKLTPSHVQAKSRRDSRPKWRNDRALATPRRGLSPLTTPRCGKEAQTTQEASQGVDLASITAHDRAIPTLRRGSSVREVPMTAPQSCHSMS